LILNCKPAGWLRRRRARPVVFAVLVLFPFAGVGETLTLSKSGPSTAREGDRIEYRLEVVNEGITGMFGVQVLDVLPEAVDFVQAVSTPGGLFDPATGIWSLPPLGTGAEDSAAELRLDVLVRAGLLADPNEALGAVNRAAVLRPTPPAPIEAELTTNIVCAFCIDWEILAVGLNTEHQTRLPDFRETRFLLDVQVANNGPVASEGTVTATRFDVSGGGFRPSLSLEPSLPVAVSLPAGETQTVRFTTNWAEGPFSTYTLSWEFEVSDQSLLDPVPPNTLAGSWTGDASDRDDDSQCVVAVAASGTFLDRQLPGVRRFRDQTLLRSRFGQRLVAWYYELSPPLARYIAGNETLRTVARLALVPVVFGVQRPGVAVVVFGGVVLLVPVLKQRRHGGRPRLAQKLRIFVIPAEAGIQTVRKNPGFRLSPE
jgi:uncharacterized repeat protein (TIGR01451 family)